MSNLLNIILSEKSIKIEPVTPSVDALPMAAAYSSISKVTPLRVGDNFIVKIHFVDVNLGTVDISLPVANQPTWTNDLTGVTQAYNDIAANFNTTKGGSGAINFDDYGLGLGGEDDSILMNAVLAANAGKRLIANPERTYTINQKVVIPANSFVDFGNANVQRQPTACDINVVSAISSGLSSVVLELANNPTELAKIKEGYHYSIVNREGDARKLDNAVIEVVSLVGTTLTATCPASTSLTWGADTASLINAFPLFELAGDNPSVNGLITNGNKDNYTHTRIYWEVFRGIQNASGAVNMQVTNSHFKECVCEGAIVGGLSTLFDKCHVSGANGNGYHFSGSLYGKVTNSYIFDTCQNVLTDNHTDGGFSFSDQIYNATVNYNIIDSCTNGIGGINSPDNSKLNIHNNVFLRFSEIGIQGYCNTGVTIDGLEIYNNVFYGSLRKFSTEQKAMLPTPSGTEVTYGKFGISLSAAATGVWENPKLGGNRYIDCGAYLHNVSNLEDMGGEMYEDRNVTGASGIANTILFLHGSGKYRPTMDSTRTADRAYFVSIQGSGMTLGGVVKGVSTNPIFLLHTSADSNMSADSTIDGLTCNVRVYMTNKIKMRNSRLSYVVQIGVSGGDNSKGLEFIGNRHEFAGNCDVLAGTVNAVVTSNIFVGNDVADAGTSTHVAYNIAI